MSPSNCPCRLRAALLGLLLSAGAFTAAVPCAQAASYTLVQIVLSNEDQYPLTIKQPSHVDTADYTFSPALGTKAGRADGDLVIPGGGIAVLSAGVRKPIVDLFGILSHDWGFNLVVCQENAGCDEARIGGSATPDGVSVDWRMINSNYFTAKIQSFDDDGWANYRNTVGALKEITAVMGKVFSIPLLDKMMGVPNEQGYKVTLKQKCPARFEMGLDLAQPPGKPPQVLMNIHRLLPTGPTDFDKFIIDDDKIFTGPYKLLDNQCRVGNTSQCQITLSSTDGQLSYAGAVGVTNRGRCSVSEAIGYSPGTFRIRNGSGAPLRYTAFVNNRMVANDEAMPGQDVNLRDTIVQVMQTVGDQECPQVPDPFMPGRRMGSCPFRLSFQGDGANGTLNCVLSTRQGTVQSPGEDKLNLYLLRSCQPQLPTSVSDRTQLRLDQFVLMSGMYKMVSVTFAPLQKD